MIPLIADPRPDTREILLVARGMAFYLDGRGEPNPVIRVSAGEQVRVTLRNDEPGVVHNFAVRGLNAATKAVEGGATGSVLFRVPEQPGSHRYVCTPHAVMMYGTLEIESARP